MKLAPFAAILSGLAGSALLAQAMPLPANIAAAAADPARAAQAADDARRHGPDILAFAGVKPGATVIEIAPGGGYWTRLFAKAVGPRGRVVADWPTALATHEKEDVAAYQAMVKDPAWANVSLTLIDAATLPTPRKADLVFTSQNYHDYLDKFMGPVDMAAFDRRVFDALKPGGVFLIIDHVALAGTGTVATEKLHRIDPALVKAQVTAAGFRFAGESRLLANPADDHAKLVFDPAIRGHTDQFIYKFVKP